MSSERSGPPASVTSGAGLPRRGQGATPRDLCIWLGTLASWRSGLVKRLVRTFGSVDEALAQTPHTLARLAGRRAAEGRDGGRQPGHAGTRQAGQGGGRQAVCSEDETRFLAVLEAGPRGAAQAPAAAGGAVVAWCDPLYPPALRQLADPPLCLFVRGGRDEDELLRRLRLAGEATAVAVVGTRGPSPYGAEMAHLLGRDLSLRGVLVVSGLAMGVDAAAHHGALDAGTHAEVATLAVLGCGADIVYPRVNRALYGEVLRRGLVVSEFAWGVPARAWRFPARNRLMAALGDAVVIVEGAQRSGARLTVDYALDLGREVLAVPGEAGRRLTAAPHAFLREGAGLCESAQDVLAALGMAAHEDVGGGRGRCAAAEAARSDLGPDYAAAVPVLKALAVGALSADQVADRCALPVHEVAGWLSRLEVDGLVGLEPGGAYRLRRR